MTKLWTYTTLWFNDYKNEKYWLDIIIFPNITPPVAKLIRSRVFIKEPMLNAQKQKV